MSVQQKIDLAIRASGSISIQDFVEISNFSKKDGFYNSEEIQKIGNKGHFITSPEISSLFGICLLYTSPSPRDKRQSRMPSSA